MLIIHHCRLLSLLIAATLLTACATAEDHAEEWVGEPIADLIEAKHKPDSYASKSGWKEQRYDVKNGHWVYVQRVLTAVARSPH
jgi:hypothetical protein